MPVNWRLRLAGRMLRPANRRSNRRTRSLAAPTAFVGEAIALGLLRQRDVQDMVMRSYESNRQFYDPAHYHLPHEEKLISVLNANNRSGTLLDAFCGQGREAKLFAEAGFDVTGIDHLDWMIDAARQNAQQQAFQAHFEVADFYDLPTQERFDVVYTSCWMLSTVQGSEARIRFLNQCRSLCKPSGVIVVSSIDDHCFGSTAQAIRHQIARSVGWLSAGNPKTEYGERIYSGLFWHHLSSNTVCREVDAADLTVTEKILGSGHEPTFWLLVPKADQ